MERETAVAVLRRDNPGVRLDDIMIYVDAYLDYMEATENINEYGVIVSHPRTGAPVENPYLRVRSTAVATMQRVRKVKRVDRLWRGERKGVKSEKS